FYRLFVADEVVIDEVDETTVAEPIKHIELCQHLIVGFCPRSTAIKLDDVAELAGERTAARELDSRIEIVAEVKKVETGDWALGDIDGEFLGRKPPFSLAGVPGLDERPYCAFRFPQNLKIRFAIEMRAGGYVTTAYHHRFSPRPANSDDLSRVLLL